MRSPRQALLLILVMLATTAHAATPATKPALVQSSYDRFKGETRVEGIHPLKYADNGVVMVCVSEVTFKGEKRAEEPAQNITLFFSFSHLNRDWSRRAPESILLIDGKTRVMLAPSAVVPDENDGKGGQSVTFNFTPDILKKIFAGKTVEMRIDTAEFTLTPEGVGALREMAKLAGL